MKKRVFPTILLGMVVSFCVGLGWATAGQVMKGKVQVLDHGDVKIHVYTAPDDSNLNSTYAVEGKTSLVLVDAQFLVPYAKEFRAYVDAIGKPIDRMIISHSHPDHIWGLDAAFGDVTAYALEATIAAIKAGAPGLLKMRKPKMGDLAPEKIVVPAHVITPGTEVIDGVTYEFEEIADGEDADQLVIRLPKQQVIIVQDLGYDEVHLFTAANLDSWIGILEKLQAEKGYDRVLVGHGVPTDKSVYGADIAYLNDAKQVLASVKSGEDYAASMAEKYPDYAGGLHHLSGMILFSKK